jgi:hypothetical protein
MSNVLYLPTDYLPDFEESKRLDKLQTMLSQWRAELAYTQKMKGLNAGEIALSSRRFHNGVRDTWRIYKGLGKTNQALKELP